MKPLININNRDGKNTVNARELHEFLEVKTQFSIWIKNRIEQYGFIEGQDYMKIELPAGMKMAETGGGLDGILNSQKILAVESMGYESFGQQGRIEYAVSIDMAKELAMVERNEKGKQARQYFIECEKMVQDPMVLLSDPKRLLELTQIYAAEMMKGNA